MAKKQNQELRSLKDLRARKSMTDSKKWTERLLEELQEGVEPEEIPIKRRKGRRNRETASRLTNDSLRGGGYTMSKMYSSKEVSDIIQKRVKKMNDKMDEIKKENEYLKEMIVDAFKKQYAEQSADGDRGALRTNDERRRAKSRGRQGGRRADESERRQ